MHKEAHFSRVGYILAMAGSAIGLGTAWKFPTMVGLGGGRISAGEAGPRGGRWAPWAVLRTAAPLPSSLLCPVTHWGTCGDTSSFFANRFLLW